MQAIKIGKVGKSLVIVLPNEVAARLKIREGDVVYLTDAENGSFRLPLCNERFAHQMGEAKIIMREDCDILRALANR